MGIFGGRELKIEVFDVPAKAGTILVMRPEEEQGKQDVYGELVDTLFPQGVSGNLFDV